MNVTIILTQERHEVAEEKFCKDMMKNINNLTREFREAVSIIDAMTCGLDRVLMVEALIDAYTYKLESLKAECIKHNVKKENIDLIFVGLGF